MRKTLKPYTFSDGTHIPEGTFLYAGASEMHFDPVHYPEGEHFDGFRFANLRQQQGGDRYNKEGSRYQLATATSDYLAWGYGRNACPGRFFAALELKLMLAHLVANYDVKFSGVEGRPSDFCIGANCFPHLSAKVMFKKRESCV